MNKSVEPSVEQTVEEKLRAYGTEQNSLSSRSCPRQEEQQSKAAALAAYRKDYYAKNKDKILEKFRNDIISCPHCERELKRPNLKKHLGTALCQNRQEILKLYAMKRQD